jgi:hypothetical protein
MIFMSGGDQIPVMMVWDATMPMPSAPRGTSTVPDESNGIIGTAEGRDDEMTGVISTEAVAGRIYSIRGRKVMLDRDLAELYGVETEESARRKNFTFRSAGFVFCDVVCQWRVVLFTRPTALVKSSI